MQQPRAISNNVPFDGYTLTALLVTLVALPAAWSTGLVGTHLVRPIIVDHSRIHWWIFWVALIAVHWLPFLLVALALRRNSEPWSSIGVDWRWFMKPAVFVSLAMVTTVLVMAAVVMPRLHYGVELPGISRTIFMGPVSTAERWFLIVGAATAGVTEEVLFRGFALTRLRRAMPTGAAVALSLVSFVYLHGSPDTIAQAVTYIVAGLAFTIPFILMNYRRLEVLIVIHFLIDASMVMAP